MEVRSFSMKEKLLKVLFIIILIFVSTLIFPNKSEFEEKLDPLYQNTFNKNVKLMKDAAKKYFNSSRLSNKVGETVFLTLGDMLDKQLIIPFVDSQNNQCDYEHSYIEITKIDDEHYLKINLQCPDKSDYIIVNMGCYNYCDTTFCEIY